MNIAQKRGLGLDGFWNRFGVVLIEAPLQQIVSSLTNYFDADSIDAFPILLNSTSRGEIPQCLWQYAEHDWTVWWGFSSEEIAFALALFLETKVLVITHQGTSGWSTIKTFYQDKWVEHYHFGSYDFEDPNQKIGHIVWGTDYWDLELNYEYFVPSGSRLPIQTKHLFKSAMRAVSESELRAALAVGQRAFGFLHATLESYGTYLPSFEETPLVYPSSKDKLLVLPSDFERVCTVTLPGKASYWQNMLSVPQTVSA